MFGTKCYITIIHVKVWFAPIIWNVKIFKRAKGKSFKKTNV